MKRVAILVLAVTASVALVLVSGCSGGDGIILPTGLGSVSGRVLAGIGNPVGFGNVVILLQTQTNPPVTVAQGTSDANGYFTVSNVPPGTYNVVAVVDPQTGFVVPPNAEPIVVTVLADQNTNLAGAITVVDANDLPPEPPAAP
jgi:hypothetical protein